jgi:hypothetical protein
MMSFGTTDAAVETHIAALRQARRGARGARGARGTAGLSAPVARAGLGDAGNRLRTRIGLGLVEAGLHLMVRARQSAPPTPYGTVVLRRSSTARGR